MTVLEFSFGSVAAKGLIVSATTNPRFYGPCLGTGLQIQPRVRFKTISGLRIHTPVRADVGVTVFAVSGLLRKSSSSTGPAIATVAADVRVREGQRLVAANAFLDQSATRSLPVVEHDRMLVGVHGSKLLWKHPELQPDTIAKTVGVGHLHRKR